MLKNLHDFIISTLLVHVASAKIYSCRFKTLQPPDTAQPPLQQQRRPTSISPTTMPHHEKDLPSPQEALPPLL